MELPIEFHFLWSRSKLPTMNGLDIVYAKDNMKKTAFLPNNSELKFSLSRKKRCIGFPDFNENIVQCLSRNKVEKGFQCSECIKKDLLLECIKCKGNCVNPKAWNYCQMTPHVVYLAAYSENFVKVGTSKKTRYKRRIAEQGANFGVKIAETKTQQEAKTLEHKIASILGLPTRKTKRATINSLDLSLDKKSIKDNLLRLKVKLENKKLIRTQDLEILDYYTPFINAIRTSEIDRPVFREFDYSKRYLKGKFLFAKGQTLLINTYGRIIFFTKVTNLYGRIFSEYKLKHDNIKTLEDF